MNATTTKKKAVPATKLSGPFYAAAGGIKKTTRGLVRPAGEVFGALTKGEARKLRKACRAAGFYTHAASRRLARKTG